MKGDFSRLRFSPSKNYTSVLQQQGRVSVDADANEQCAINDYLRTTETIDVVGVLGGPVHDEGFAINVLGDTITIGAGRYYVDGILCENTQALWYSTQPYLINPSPDGPQLLASLRQGSITVIQLYLQVWRRLVTALDDPCLREPALGLADTTARLQTVWRVIAQTVAPPTQTGSTGTTSGTTVAGVPTNASGGLTLLSDASAARLQIANTSAPAAVLATNASATGLTINQPAATTLPVNVGITGNCCESMGRTIGLLLKPGTMSAQTSGGSGDCSCQPTPAAGYRSLENQLYRVEIHHAGSQATATFKWSRENGSVVAAITSVSGSQVYVDSLGPDANLGFAPGQWVEIYDDSNPFGERPNQPGELYQIKSVSPATLSVAMTQPVAFVDPTRNARMRRWDQSGTTAGVTGISLAAGSWLSLENGIEVQFGSGNFQSGDHWLIPARTATGNIEWPPCDSDGSAFQPPHRIEIFTAPLACIQWDGQKQAPHVQDCRKVFYPLTELTPPAASTALHVSKFNWVNDDVTTLDQLVASGLTVALDQAPSSPINGANVVVTFEPAVAPTNTNDTQALAVFSAANNALPSTILRGITIVDAQIALSGSTLSWQLPFSGASLPQQITIEFLDALISAGAPARWFARVRVRLLGRAIFSGSGVGQLFLDGQSFGQPAVRADGKTPRIDLQLPSGNDERASDFEGWFYVAPTQQVVSLTINHPSLLVNADNTVADANTPTAGVVSPQGTIGLQYPAIKDTVVGLSISGPSATRIFTIPTSVTVLKDQTSATFAITVQGSPGATAVSWTIIGSLPNAVGVTSTAQATLTLRGPVKTT